MVMILRIDPHVERVKLTDVYGGSAHGNVICRLISSPRSEVSHFDKVELTFGRQDILFQEYDIEDQKTVFAYEFASMKDVIFVGNGLILPWSGERLDAPSTSAIEYEREITFLGEIDNPTYDEDHQLHQDERRIPKLGLESRKHEAVSLHFRGWRNDEIAKHFHVSSGSAANYVKAGRKMALDAYIGDMSRLPELGLLFGLPNWAMLEVINDAIKVETDAIHRKREIVREDWKRIADLERYVGEWPERFSLQRRRDFTMQGISIMTWDSYD